MLQIRDYWDPTALAIEQSATMHSMLNRIKHVDVPLGHALKEVELDTRPTTPYPVSVKHLFKFLLSNFVLLSDSYHSFGLSYWV